MRIVMLTLAVICMSGNAFAQFTTSGAHGSGERPVTIRANVPIVADRLAAQLDLNEGQKAQLQGILAEQRAKLDEYLQEQKASGQDPTMEQLRSMKEQLQKETIDRLRSILTETQLQKLERLVQADGGGLFAPPQGMTVGINAPDAVCDSSGKCTAR